MVGNDGHHPVPGERITVGREANATLKLGRRTPVAGKALLETSELIFRGPERLRISFKDITGVEAKGGQLRITHNGGDATFELGDQAEIWAEKIKHPKSRIEKLGIKPEHRVAVYAIADSAFIRELKSRAMSVSVGRSVKDADAIFVGASKLDDLRLADRVPSLKRDGAIWTVTPKGKGGIKDTDIMAAGKAAGLVDVKVVSFSDTHSANKFVIPKAKR